MHYVLCGTTSCSSSATLYLLLNGSSVASISLSCNKTYICYYARKDNVKFNQIKEVVKASSTSGCITDRLIIIDVKKVL